MTFPYAPGPYGTVPPEYARLREQEPVARVPLADGTHVWLVTRHADVVEVLTNPVFSRRQAAALPGSGLGRSQGGGILDLDPPAHDRLRGPVQAAFAADRIRRWRGRIEELAAEGARTLSDMPEPVDIVAAYAAPFAGRVICELLGVEGAGWSALTADVEWVLLGAGEPSGALAETRRRIEDAIRDLLARRRAEPADDVATSLLTDADLTDDERVAVLHGLVISGFIGVRDLLSRHLFGVLADRSLACRLAARPADQPAAVEELLRFYPSSNDGLLRVATEAVELAGTVLPAGAAVLPLVSAAARDPRLTPDPERLDIDRCAGPTIAFGAGAHACPAEDLARLELQVGIGSLLGRYPELRLAGAAADVEHRRNLLPLGIERLLVLLGPAVAQVAAGDAAGSGRR
jgi:cytochrome P450